MFFCLPRPKSGLKKEFSHVFNPSSPPQSNSSIIRAEFPMFGVFIDAPASSTPTEVIPAPTASAMRERSSDSFSTWVLNIDALVWSPPSSTSCRSGFQFFQRKHGFLAVGGGAVSGIGYLFSMPSVMVPAVAAATMGERSLHSRLLVSTMIFLVAAFSSAKGKVFTFFFDVPNYGRACLTELG